MRAWLLGTTALLPAAGALGQTVAPNTLPTGGRVSAGSAAISQSGTAMQVTQTTDRAAINWQGFSVGAGASVNFQQPSAASWTLNRVVGPDPSVIAGSITANGGVAIVNQSGMVFAQGAQVNVGSLIASAANITDANFMAGKMVFDGAPNEGAKVENHGDITVADRGLAALVGPRVGNSGTIRARLGRVALQGAETYSLDLAGDGLLSIDVTQAVRTTADGATALVTNSGSIDASGGSVLISAHAASALVEDLVRNTGQVRADTTAGRTGQVALRADGGGVRVDGTVTARGGATERGGHIEARGSTATTVGATAEISASGGTGGGTVLVGTSGIGRNQAMSARTTVERGARLRANARTRGNGGTIAVNSSQRTVAKGDLAARGGAEGGDGGLVELSGRGKLEIAARVDVAAPAGRNGTLLLDPQNIRVVADADMPADQAAAIVAAGEGSEVEPAPGALVVAGTLADDPGSVLFVSAGSINALAAGTVTLQASEGISIQAVVVRAGDTLNLFADGAISQSATGTITADRLVIRGFDGGGTAAGSASLNLANSIGTLDAMVSGGLGFSNSGALTVARAAGATVALTAGGGGAMALTGAVGGEGAIVGLTSGGNLTQTADGIITAATLTANALGGSITLGEANVVSAFNVPASVPGAITFVSTADLTAGRMRSTGTVSLTGRSLTLGAVDGFSTIAADTLILDATGGGISQTAGFSILDSATSGPVTLIARATATDPAEASIILLGTGNLIVTLDATAEGALSVVSGTGMQVTRAAGASVALTVGGAGTLTVRASADEGRGIAAAGAVSIEADALVIGAVTGTNGEAAVRSTGGTGTISLRTDALDWAGKLDATAAGTVEIGPRTAGRAVEIGSLEAAAGTLLLDPTGFTDAGLLAGTIRVGETTIGSAVRGGTLAVTSALQPGAAAAAGALELVAGTDLELRAATGRDDLALVLRAGGAITQTAAGVLAGNALRIRGLDGVAGAGSVALATADNLAAGLDGIATGGLAYRHAGALVVERATITGTGQSLLLESSGDLVLAGALGGSGNTVTLHTDGAASQNPGSAITATTLTVRDLAGGATNIGTVTLDQPGNSVATLDAAAGAGLSFDNGATDLSVGRATAAAGGTVALTTTGALSLAGSIGGTATTDVSLSADGGVSQPGGTVTAGQLTIRGASAALGQDNLVGTLDAVATGDIGFTNGSAALAVAQARSTGTGAAIGITTGGALTLTGVVGGTDAAVVLAAAGSIGQTADGIITAATLDATATGGAVALTAAANAVRSVVAQASGAGNGVALATGTALAVGASGITAGTGAAIGLTGSSIALDGVLGFAAADAANTVALTATAGGITQGAGGAIATSALALDAATSIDLTTASGNAFASLTATSAGGSILAASSTAFATAPGGITAAAGSSIGLSAPGLSIGHAVGFAAADPANVIALRADALSATAAIDAGATGLVTIRPASAGQVEVAAATAAGALHLSAATLGNVFADRLVIAAGGIAVTGAADFTGKVGTLELTAAGDITQGAGGALAVGRLAASAATGGIALGATVNAIGEITGTTADAAVGLSAAGDITLTTGGALSVAADVVAGGGQTIALTADALATTAALRLAAEDAANRIRLTADAMTFAAPVTAGIGRVALRPRTADASVELGGATVAGALALSAASLAEITASQLDIMATGTGGIVISGEAAFRDGAVDAGSSIGGVRVGTLALDAANIADTAAGALNIGGLQATAAGSIAIGNGAHAVDALVAQAPGVIRFSGTRDLAVTADAPAGARAGTVLLAAPSVTLAGDVRGTTVGLVATAPGGGIAQAGGTVLDAGRLLLATNGGNATLANAGNLVDWLAAANLVQAAPDPAIAGTLRLVSASDLGLGRDGGAGIVAGSIDITVSDPARGIIARDAANEVVLRAIGSGGGAGSLTLTADSMALAPSGAGAIGNTRLEAGGGGLVTIRPLTTAHGIQAGGTAPGTALLLAPDALGATLAGRLVLGRASGGAIDLAGAMDLPGVTVLELLSAAGITQRGGATLDVAGLTATAGGDILLDQANAIGTITASTADAARGLTAGGDIHLRSTGPLLTVAQAMTAGTGRTITLRVQDLAIAGAVRAPGGIIEILPDSPGRGITLGGAVADTLSLDQAELRLLGGSGGGGLDSGAATLLRIGSADTGDIGIAGAVDLQGAVARFQALELLSGGNLDGSGGAISVPALRAKVAGEVVLDNAGNDFLVNAVTTTGTDRGVTIRQAGDLRLASAVAAVGGLDAAGGVTAPDGTVRLIAGGGITQDSGALISANTLRLEAGAAVTLGEANRFATLAGASVTGGPASLIRGTGYTVAGPVEVAGALELVADTSLGITGSIATTGRLDLLAGSGDLTLDGAVLDAGAGLLARAGADIAVTAGSMTAGTGITLSAAQDGTPGNAGTISLVGTALTAGTGLSLAAGGGIGIAGTTLEATAGALDAGTAAGGIAITASTLTAATTLDLTAGAGGITMQSADLAIGSLATLTAASGIDLAASTIGTGGLVATSTAGDITLNGTVVTAAGAVALTASAGRIALQASEVTAGTTAMLTAPSGIGIDASTVAAGTGALQATTATGAIGITDAAALRAGTTIGLAATTGSIGIDVSEVIAGTAATFTAGAGIGIAGSVIRADGGGFQASTASGDLAITGGVLDAAAAIGLNAGAGTIGIGGATVVTQTDLGLSAGAIAIDSSLVTARGTATLAGASGIGITNSAVRTIDGALEASTTTGDIAIADATLAAATDATLAAGGAITLARGTLSAGRAGLVSAGSDLILADTAVTAGTGLTLGAGHDMTVTGATLAAATGPLDAGTTTGRISMTDTVATAGGAVTLLGGGGLSLATSGIGVGAELVATARLGDVTLADSTLTAAGALAVTAASGAVTQTRGGIIGGGDISLRGGTDVTLTDAGSGSQPVLRSTAGAVLVQADAGQVAFRNTAATASTTLGILAGGAVTLADGSLTAAGRLGIAARGGALDITRGLLLSTAGDLDLTAGGEGAITASTLRADAAAGGVRVVVGGSLRLTGMVVDAAVADFEAGRLNPVSTAAYGATDGRGMLTNDGVAASIGTGILFAAPGGISDLGPTIVTPRGTLLPAVLYDTRTGPDRNPLTLVQPDTAGLPAARQPTQVRGAPGSQSPGAFGAANLTTAAGRVAMDVDAGSSAVFLLVDGGDIEGNIIAGRLGVHGAGGAMSIFGTLSGFSGAEAARFADITRPIDPGRLQRYRINGCVVGSINCVVPPSIQIIPPRTTDRAPFTIENSRINTSDVLIPNIAEEDDDE
jgi:filamentous hemagglutinin family protein